MFYKKSYIFIPILLFVVFVMTACVGNQTAPLSPQYTTTSPTAIRLPPTFTIEPSLTPTSVYRLDLAVTPTSLVAVTAVQTPSDTERLCSDADFSPAELQPDLDDPDTLIGFRPPRNWEPGPGWELNYGSLIYGTGFHVAAHQQHDDYLVLFNKRVCRYGINGQYSLAEIVDYVLLSDLGTDEIIIKDLNFEVCCIIPDLFRERLEYQIEMFVFAECGELPDNPLIRANYDINSLPEKIEPGFELPVAIISGWFSNTTTGAFEQLAVDDISCVIHFAGK